MPEWIKELIIAIGGGAVVLVGILTIFKKLFIKLFETGIESYFEKNLEKYKNRISRSTKAFEILLEREMGFYEKIGPIFAELIPLIQDLSFYLKNNEELERQIQCESYRNCLIRYVELIKELKNVTLLHHTYLPGPVFVAFTKVGAQMQEYSQFWLDAAKRLFESECEKIDYEHVDRIVEDLLMYIAKAEKSIQVRLTELSEI